MKYVIRRALPALALFLASSLVACGDDTETGPDDGPKVVCGDGDVGAGEACDDGNKVSGDGCSATCQNETAGACGDGTINIGEQCDDGNAVAGDGCSPTCTTEVPGVCGDTVVNVGEQCDDGNTTAGDGCSATCQNESTAMCGNGIVEPGEDCDDGNATGFDGCENDCTESVSEVTCENLAATADVCTVTPGNASIFLKGVVLGEHTIFRGGQVLIGADGKIACTGCDCAAMAAGATTVVCPEGVISPGLINTHDHITYASDRPYNDSGERYEHRHDWRRGTNNHTEIPSSGGASADEIRYGELRFLLSGATSLVGSGSASGFLRNLDRNDQEGLGIEPVHFETFPLGDSDGTQLDSGCNYPGIDTQQSIADDDAYLPHISEGIDHYAQNEFTCVDNDEGTHDLLEDKSAFIHGAGLDAGNYAEMAAAGTSLIWSPRSNITLYGDTAVVTAATRLGVNVALGTDWIPTGSMNMFRELTCADELNAGYYANFFTDRQLWQMVTRNAARAVAAENVIGTLRAGLTADIAIYDGRTHKDYRAIIDGEAGGVALVLRGGKTMFGDQAVVSAMPGAMGCDTLEVCSVSKSLCAQSDIGKTYQQLVTSVGSQYNLTSCGVPPNEPSCLPRRPMGRNGSSVYTGMAAPNDPDGDGIPDAMDSCPDVFNPVRPMDDMVQADFDQDGVGDACDPCPVNANTTVCDPLPPGDSDGDGIANDVDNCPADPNPMQEDADGDMKGDVCDPCPGDANPGNLACPATIYQVKSGAIAGDVRISNAIITGCKDARGYFLQVKEGDAGYMGADNSGIFVFDPTTSCATLAPGNRVDLTTATVSNFFDQIQLTFAQPTVIAMGEALPAPIVVTSAAASGAMPTALEAVLVTVQDVEVTAVNPPPGPGDAAPTNEIVVDGVLKVNDFLFLLAPLPSVGVTYASITGILDYRNGAQKLEPRSAADFVLGAAALAPFNEALSYTRVGSAGAPTFPTPLRVQLTAPAPAGGLFVGITSSSPNLTVSGGGVTVAAGATGADVLVSGIAQNVDVTLTATLGAITETSHVRVLGAAEQPTMLVLEPDMVTVSANGTATIEAMVDIPVAANLIVSLSVADAGAGTVPATATILANTQSVSFQYTDAGIVSQTTINATAGALTASATVDVVMNSGNLVINEVDYDSIGNGEDAEFVEIFNPTGSPISLANLTLVAINGNGNAEYDRFDLAAAGTLGPGQYLVLGSSSITSSLMAPILTITLPASSIQNGAPDALGILDLGTGLLVDAVSYEGAIEMGQVMGLGARDFSEGTAIPMAVADNNATTASIIRFPNGADTNDGAADWALTTTPTPGGANLP